MKIGKQRFPIALVVIVVITSVFTLLQFAYPEVLSQLRRNPAALDRGEWWRIVTPLLVHADGWIQYVANMICLIMIGFAAERLFGPARFILLYFVGGLVGQLAGYASWDPYGAGASVGFCGLIGGLCVVMLSRGGRVNPISALVALFFVVSQVGIDIGNKFVAIALIVAVCLIVPLAKQMKDGRRGMGMIVGIGTLACAIFLLTQKDIHGAAVLAGACAALALRAAQGRYGWINRKDGIRS